jgi:hypothetical protein
MAINATNTAPVRELIPSGNYSARCYQMVHIGTVEELILGEKKIQNKVRIGWELPTELKVFDPEKGEQPFVISKEFTLSMHEKSNLRKTLASWRCKDFSEDEAKCFDITKLIGVPCMLNVIHKPSKDGTKTYQEVGSVSPMPKGLQCPEQINKSFIFEYDNFDPAKLEVLPDFIKTKIKSSFEYAAIQQPNHLQTESPETFDPNGFNPGEIEDLPF